MLYHVGETSEGTLPILGGCHDGIHHDAAAGLVNDVVTGCVYEFKPNNESRKEGPMNYPRMPWIVDNDVPRQKAIISQLYNAMVSRLVSRSEVLSSPDAFAFMKKEWKSLSHVSWIMMRSSRTTGPRMRRSSSHGCMASVSRRIISSRRTTREGSSKDELCCLATK